MNQNQSPYRCPTPGPDASYDVINMCEEEYERKSIYIVPDLPCPRGTTNRAEKTLPRSLTLKTTVVRANTNIKVRRFC